MMGTPCILSVWKNVVDLEQVAAKHESVSQIFARHSSSGMRTKKLMDGRTDE